MYQALYRKYRPKSFEDVVGQKIIIKTLSNAILNNKISHAYLFTGPRGTGKTSIAKILAKIVNCENPSGVTPCDQCNNCVQINSKQSVDIIEIDAASNNGVDEIRELREKVNLVPSIGKYKVYIIDEVHMLTTSAFNALLKTLEEPPKHIIFILATTEPHKIPLTILSRCQRYDFKKITFSEMVYRLKYICSNENIEITDDSLMLIAKLSDGGMRDAISLLDQLNVYSNEKIEIEDVHDVCGTLNNDILSNFVLKLADSDLQEIFKYIDDFDNNGKNLLKIIELLIEYLKNCLIYCNCSSYFDKEDRNNYELVCNKITENKINQMIEIFLDTLNLSKKNNNLKLLFELAIIKIVNISESLKKNKSIELLKEEKILYEPPHIEVEKKIEKIELTELEINRIENLKKIRVNNTLANFDKKDLQQFKNKLEDLKILLMDPQYSSTVSLILDGELKAKGQQNILFVFANKNLNENFNSQLQNIEKIFKKVYGIDYKPIAVSVSEWEDIKIIFNNSIKENKKIYTYIPEKIENDEKNVILESSSEKKQEKSKENSLEQVFDDIIVYES